MSYYLNINLSKFNPEIKISRGKYEPIRLQALQRLRIDKHQLFRNFNFFTKLQSEK